MDSLKKEKISDRDRSNTIANLRKVLSVNSKLSSTLELEELLGIIMVTAADVIRSEAASLMLIDESTQELVFEVALGEKGKEIKEKFRIKLGEGIAGTVAQTGTSLIVNDTQKDQRFAQKFDKGTGFSSKAILCVPMKAKEKIIGILEAINPIGRSEFSASDLELFESFANQAAIAIENAKLHDQILKQEKQKQELKIAHQIQQNFLPNMAALKKEIDIAAKNIPAKDIGGDLYDTIQLDEQRFGILIGDVSGKGVPAALYMIRTISDFRFLASTCANAADLLRRLNNILVKESRFGMFVTLLYLIVDKAENKIRYASAGHLPILRKSKNSKDWQPLPAPAGMPIGVMPDAVYAEQALDISPGDVLLLYTDGIIEARDKSGQEYTLDRLMQCGGATGKAEELVARIFQDVENFSRGRDPHDDMTVVSIIL